MTTRTQDPFELDGGALCLDFVNTCEDHGCLEGDKLCSWADLLAFARQTEIVTEVQAEKLATRAARDPDGARGAFEEAKRLRDLLYRLFSPRTAGERPDPVDLQALSAAHAEAAARRRLVADGESITWKWEGLEDSLSAPLAPIATSAAELLVHADLDRLRECDGTSCTWLFLDASRNRSRRWCSMETCGNRAKARRHYRRRSAAD